MFLPFEIAVLRVVFVLCPAAFTGLVFAFVGRHSVKDAESSVTRSVTTMLSGFAAFAVVFFIAGTIFPLIYDIYSYIFGTHEFS